MSSIAPIFRDTDVRSTPQALFDELNRVHLFTLDAAANADNRKCPRYYGPGGEAENALAIAWPVRDRIWMNPPYSRGLQRKFVEKAIETEERGGYVVALLPADTSTRLYHQLIKERRHEFLPRRIKFNGSATGAKFGSMVVIFSQQRVVR